MTDRTVDIPVSIRLRTIGVSLVAGVCLGLPLAALIVLLLPLFFLIEGLGALFGFRLTTAIATRLIFFGRELDGYLGGSRQTLVDTAHQRTRAACQKECVITSWRRGRDGALHRIDRPIFREPRGPDAMLMRSALGNVNAPVALLFAGNAAVYEDMGELIDFYHSQGFHVAALNTRGYAECNDAGTANPETFKDDPWMLYRAVKKELSQRHDMGFSRVLLHGHSLGGTAALALAFRIQQEEHGAVTVTVVLDRTFNDVGDAAAGLTRGNLEPLGFMRYVFGWLTKGITFIFGFSDRLNNETQLRLLAKHTEVISLVAPNDGYFRNLRFGTVIELATQSLDGTSAHLALMPVTRNPTYQRLLHERFALTASINAICDGQRAALQTHIASLLQRLEARLQAQTDALPPLLGQELSHLRRFHDVPSPSESIEVRRKLAELLRTRQAIDAVETWLKIARAS